MQIKSKTIKGKNVAARFDKHFKMLRHQMLDWHNLFGENWGSVTILVDGQVCQPQDVPAVLLKQHGQE